MFQDSSRSCVKGNNSHYFVPLGLNLCIEVSLFCYEILQFLGFFFLQCKHLQLVLSQDVLMFRYHILKARTHILMDNVFCNQNCWGINSSCESHTNSHNLAHLFKGCNGQLSVVYNIYKTSIFWKKYYWNLLKMHFHIGCFYHCSP